MLPYGYACAWHCVAPVRSTGHWGYPCALSVGHSGALCLAYFVRLSASIAGLQCLPSGASSGASSGAIAGHLVRCSAAQCYPYYALGYPLAILSALHCADSVLRCALPTRAHIHYPALSPCYPILATFIRKLIRNDVTGVGGF